MSFSTSMCWPGCDEPALAQPALHSVGVGGGHGPDQPAERRRQPAGHDQHGAEVEYADPTVVEQPEVARVRVGVQQADPGRARSGRSAGRPPRGGRGRSAVPSRATCGQPRPRHPVG